MQYNLKNILKKKTKKKNQKINFHCKHLKRKAINIVSLNKK